jgi:hypothetical protein
LPRTEPWCNWNLRLTMALWCSALIWSFNLSMSSSHRFVIQHARTEECAWTGSASAARCTKENTARKEVSAYLFYYLIMLYSWRFWLIFIPHVHFHDRVGYSRNTYPFPKRQIPRWNQKISGSTKKYRTLKLIRPKETIWNI